MRDAQKRYPLQLALFAFAALCTHSPASEKLTFRNEFDAPVIGAPFSVDAQGFYAGAGLPLGSPVKVQTTNGGEVPSTLSADGKSLLFYCALAAHEQLDASVTAERAPAKELYSLASNRIETPTSGFRFEKSGGSFYFRTRGGDALGIINGLSLRCWVDTEDHGMLNADKAREYGLARIRLSEQRAKSVKNRETPTTLHILQHKRVDGVSFEEEAVLHKEEPLLEYIVRITNTGDKPVYLANMTGTEAAIVASYGTLFKKNRLILRRNSKQGACPPVLELRKGGTTSDALKPSQGWNRCATYCTTDEGYGLGVVMARRQKFSPMWHRWTTSLNGFAIPTTTAQSPLPVKIDPQETVEFAIAVYAVPPGNDGFSWVLHKHDQYWQKKPFSAQTQTSVKLNGKALSEPFVPEKILPEKTGLIQPYDGATVSDVAATFAYEAAKNAVTYHIQIAKGPDFRSLAVDGKTWRFRGRTAILHHALKNPLPPGTYYWRICGETQSRDAGPWSETRRVVIEPTQGNMPLVRPVTPENPVFKIEVWKMKDMATFLKNLPADLPKAITPELDRETAAALNRADVDAIRNSGRSFILNFNLPLCMVEALLKTCPNIIGIDAGEDIGTYERFERMARLCAKYGRYLMFFGGNESKFEWAERFSDPKWNRLFSQYGSYFLFGHKSNQSNVAYTAMSTLMGAWLNGQIGVLGMHYEAFYWDHAGYRTKLDECFGFRGGNCNMMPPNFWNLQLLVGLTQGCSLLSLGGQGNVIQGDNNKALSVPFWEEKHRGQLPENRLWTAVWTSGGHMTAVWDRFVGPFIKGVLDHDLMLTRSEVEAMIPAAVVGDLPVHSGRHNNNWLDYNALYNTYGLENDYAGTSELIPNHMQTYWIPLLYGPLKQWSGKTIRFSELQTAENVKRNMKPSPISRSTGNAFAVTTSEKFYIMNSGENLSAEQFSGISFPNDAISRLDTHVTRQKYIMGRNTPDGHFWLQANTAWPEDPTILKLTGKNAERVTVTPPDALIDKQVDGKQTTYTLSHEKGVVELDCGP